MWSFETPADFQRKVDWARNFLTSEVAQLDLLHGHASDRRTPRTGELFRSLRDRVRSAGLWGPNLQRSLGGSELSYVERVLLDEAIGTSRWAPAVFGYVPHQAWCAHVLAVYADPASRDRYVSAIRLGDAVASYALNEPYVGGTKSHLRTTAAREGGRWVVRGEKWFIDHAGFADLFLVVARTRPGAPAREAFTLFLVPADAEGVEVLRVSSIGGQDPRFANFGHVAFRDVKLPDAAVLGEIHGAYAALQACRRPLELHEQGRAVSIMRRCLEMMAEHAVTHESKRGALAEFGTTRIALGKTRYDVESYRLVLLHTAWLADTAGEDASTESVLAAKAALPRIMDRVVRRAAHLHGALGVLTDMPFPFWRAWADTLGVSEGNTESFWEDLGKLIMAGTGPRSRYTWPADHIPTATSILRESMEAVRWLDSPSTGV